MSTEKTLKIEDVSVVYEDRQGGEPVLALSGVNLEIETRGSGRCTRSFGLWQNDAIELNGRLYHSNRRVFNLGQLIGGRLTSCGLRA